MTRDVIVHLGRVPHVTLHGDDVESWTVTLAETGVAAMTGARVKHVEDGEPQSVIELVTRILARMGRLDLSPTILDEASNEIVDQYLGWSPRVALDEALTRTIAWYRNLLAAER